MDDQPPRARELRLVLERGARPVAGSCSEGSSPPERFVGWLALLAILERDVEGSEDVQRPPFLT